MSSTNTDYTAGYITPVGKNLEYAKSMYILGEAPIGVTNEPVKIRNLDECKNTFGTGPLTRAWNEAYQTIGNDINIYLVRVNGSEADGTIYGYDMEGGGMYEAIRLISTDSGTIWNEVSVMHTDEYMIISNPESIGGYAIFYYDEYKTLSQLVYAINEYNNRGQIGVRAYTTDGFRLVDTIKTHYENLQYEQFYLKNGDDEVNLSKNQLHSKLEITYNILEGQQIDVICLVNAYFDDISPLAYYNDSQYGNKFYNARRDYLDKEHATIPDKPATFHGQLIEFCKAQIKNNILTHAVMAFNPTENVEDVLRVNSYSIKAAKASCLYDRHDIVSETDTTNDYGKYLSIVIGEFQYNDINGRPYYSNGYLSYAATIASKLTADSTTNMSIPNISRMRYHLEDEEIEFLGKLGCVTFRKSILKNSIVVSNGVTAAMSSSPYHIVSNVRMVQLIMSAYNTALETYIGEDVDRLNKTEALQKAVDSVTTALLSDGVAKDIKANVVISPYGVAVLTLSIMCNYSIEYVKASANIKL